MVSIVSKGKPSNGKNYFQPIFSANGLYSATIKNTKINKKMIYNPIGIKGKNEKFISDIQVSYKKISKTVHPD